MAVVPRGSTVRLPRAPSAALFSLARVADRAASPAVLVGLTALVLNLWQLNRGVGIWDTAEFQTVGTVLGIGHSTGFPSYTLLAWLASVLLQPFGEPALRANVLSAILGAGGVAFTAATVMALTNRAVLAGAAGLALATAPIAWALGIRADAHSLHFFLVPLLLYLLVRWWNAHAEGDRHSGRWLFAAAVTFAVSLGNHGITGLLAPGIAAFILLVEPRLPFRAPRLVVACAAVIAVLVVALYAYLPIRSAMDPPLDWGDPQTWDGFRYVVFGEAFQGDIRQLDVAKVATSVPAVLIAQLGIAAPLVVVGLLASLVLIRPFAVMTLAWFLLTFVFASVYTNVDLPRYYLVALIVSVTWAAVGVETMWRLSRRQRVALVRALGRPLVPRSDRRRIAPLLIGVALVVPIALAVPYRLPQIRHAQSTAGDRWASAALAALPQDAVVLADWSFATPLWYKQFATQTRSDVLVIDDQIRYARGLGSPFDTVDRFIGRRPVFIVPWPRSVAEQFRERYRLLTVASVPSWGTMYEVLPATSATGDDGSP